MKVTIRHSRAMMLVGVALALAILACGPVTAPTTVPPTKAPPPTRVAPTTAPEPTEAVVTEAVPTKPAAKPTTKPATTKPAPTQASAGGAAFVDDFSNPNSGWGVGTSATSSATYGTNEFVMKVMKAKWFSWSTAGQTDLSNVHIEVKAQKLTATGGASFGIMCNFQDKDNYYLMGFSTDGYYAIIKTENGQDTFLTSTTSKWAKTTAYKLNASSYLIGADCADGQLTLYVDGAQVDSVSDSTFTKGDVGLFVNTFDQAKSEVHFANFVAAPMGGGGSQAGQVVFQDNFSDPNSGWDATSGDNHATAYGQNDYVVTVSKASKIGWGNAGQTTLADIHIDVTAKNTGAAKDAAFGIICNYKDTNNFYYLGITSDGYYAIVKVLDNQDSFFTSTVNKWEKTTKFKLNAASYKLGADCGNGTITLYVDGKEIDTASDDTFTEGDVGLFAGTFDAPNAEVHFSNFVATSLK